MERIDRKPEEIKKRMEESVKHASGPNKLPLKKIAELQEKRALRLSKAKERLKARLGENDPKVITLDRAVYKANSSVIVRCYNAGCFKKF